MLVCLESRGPVLASGRHHSIGGLLEERGPDYRKVVGVTRACSMSEGAIGMSWGDQDMTVLSQIRAEDLEVYLGRRLWGYS